MARLRPAARGFGDLLDVAGEQGLDGLGQALRVGALGVLADGLVDQLADPALVRPDHRQAGADYAIAGPWSANLDVKKVFFDTTATDSVAGLRSKVKLNPWVISAGVGYRF